MALLSCVCWCVCGSCASVYACVVYYIYLLVMSSIRAGLVISVVHCLALACPSLCPLSGAWSLCNVLCSFAHALIVHMLHYASSITYCFCCYLLCFVLYLPCPCLWCIVLYLAYCLMLIMSCLVACFMPCLAPYQSLSMCRVLLMHSSLACSLCA